MRIILSMLGYPPHLFEPGRNLAAATRQTLDAIFRDQREALVATLYRLVGCLHTAEDLAHEAYLRVAAALAERPIRHPQPFLYQTARNLALDHLRTGKSRRRFVRGSVEEQELHGVASTAPIPEQIASDGQRLQRLNEALAELPARAREVLILHRLHGFSYPAIAERLQVSQTTVQKDLRLALAHCAAALADADLL